MTEYVDKLSDPEDPWRRRNQQQPPNIDEILSDFGKGAFGSDKGSGGNVFSYFILFAVLAFWFVSGLYIVKPAEEAVVVRFGKYYETNGPGLHWFARGIENVFVLNTNEIENYSYSSEMLTEDENYARVALTVYYRINDAKAFLFNVNDPIESLQGAVQSSLRQVIGHTHLEEVLTFGKEKTRSDAAVLIDQILASYNTGIEVTDVKLQEATVPSQVLSAFDSVITAREEKAAKISKGQRYVKRVIPEANGQAKRVIASATALQSRVIFDAKADVAKFLALLPEYKENADIMEKRLYYQTMERVLPRVDKVYATSEKPMLFLNMPADTKKDRTVDSSATISPELKTMLATKE